MNQSTSDTTSEMHQKEFKNILKHRPKPNPIDDTRLLEEPLPSLDKSLRLASKKSMRKPIQLLNPFDEFDIAEKAVIDFIAPAELTKSMIITNNRQRSKYELELLSKQSLESAFDYFLRPKTRRDSLQFFRSAPRGSGNLFCWSLSLSVQLALSLSYEIQFLLIC